jgi:hypothetical protein
MDLVLSENQFDLVYNSFSFVIACDGGGVPLLPPRAIEGRTAPPHGGDDLDDRRRDRGVPLPAHLRLVEQRIRAHRR